VPILVGLCTLMVLVGMWQLVTGRNFPGMPPAQRPPARVRSDSAAAAVVFLTIAIILLHSR